MVDRDSPHLPHPAVIDSYGNGGFRFAGLSHLGSLLCTLEGIWASPITAPQQITADTFHLVYASEPAVEHFLIGTGRDPWMVPPALKARAREAGFTIEAMTTPAAVHTYNILVDEGRRAAALLIALE